MLKTGIKKLFTPKAAKRLENVYVSESGVKSAFYRVRRELKDMDLLFEKSRMSKVKVIWELLSIEALGSFVGIMGFYNPQTQDIHIPAIWPAALLPWYKERGLTDVLRHEFGHALEGKFSKFFHDENFKKAFGAEYGEIEVAREGDERNYVSDYARKYTQEDFAETFMFFLRHKGVLPKEFSRRKAIRAKWDAVASICHSIAKMKK